MLKATQSIAEVWALLGGVLLLAIMAITSVNVAGFGLDRIARLAGGSVTGLPGYEDFVTLAVGCAALMFLPLCQARRSHVTVDLATGLLPRAVRRWLDRLWLAAIVCLAVFLCYSMSLGSLETRSDNVLSPILGWPVWPFYGPGIVSLALWAWVGLAQLLDAPGDD